jgi:glutathione S-transferase
MPADAKLIFKERLAQRLKWVDGELAGKTWLLGDAFSVADGYLFTVCSWCKYVDLDISALAQLNAYLARVAARPSVQAALKAEGLVK